MVPPSCALSSLLDILSAQREAGDTQCSVDNAGWGERSPLVMVKFISLSAGSVLRRNHHVHGHQGLFGGYWGRGVGAGTARATFEEGVLSRREHGIPWQSIKQYFRSETHEEIQNTLHTKKLIICFFKMKVNGRLCALLAERSFS